MMKSPVILCKIRFFFEGGTINKLLAALVCPIFLSGCFQSGGHGHDGWDDEEIGEFDEPGRDDGPDLVPDGPACGNGILEDGEECDDGNPETSDGCEQDCTFSCHAAAECEDGESCTSDDCVAGGSGRICVNAPDAGWCLIDGSCRSFGEEHPENPCLWCNSEADPTAWTGREAGFPCDNGLFCDGHEDICNRMGECLGASSPCPDGECSICDEDARQCRIASSGTECRPAIGACDVAEACDGVSVNCPPDVFVPAGTPCDDGSDCTDPDACDGNGACTGVPIVTPPPPSPQVPQNGEMTGSPWAPSSFGLLRPVFKWSWPDDGCGEPLFEVQVDDSCPTTGFQTCTFASPEATGTISGREWRPTENLPVSTTAPVGRRYFWRMRACRGLLCSAWSQVRYVDVGRVECDLNGDGFSDLAVGAPGQREGADEEGHVFVYLGGPTGIAASPSLSLDNPENEGWGRMGTSISAGGDINADGFSDLVAGAPSQDGQGAAFLYLGSAEGLPDLPDQSISSQDPMHQAMFGFPVAVLRDLNLDGFADLAIGAPGQAVLYVRDGAVSVYLGSASGIEPDSVIVLTSPHPRENGRLGESLAPGGDLDADGYGDLLVGAGCESPARVYLFGGGPVGVSVAPGLTIDSPLGFYCDGSFAYGVTGVSDVNADGYPDFLVSGRSYSSTLYYEQGAAWLYLGSPVLTGTPDLLVEHPSPSTTGHFGHVVAGIGDADRDGLADFLIGAPGQSDAVIFWGSVTDLVTASPLVLHGSLDFGHSVASPGDLNGDGYPDIAIGEPKNSAVGSREGAVFGFYGGPAGFPASASITLQNPTHQVNGDFGWSIAALFNSVSWGLDF